MQNKITIGNINGIITLCTAKQDIAAITLHDIHDPVAAQTEFRFQLEFQKFRPAFANVSILIAEGKRRIREISVAAASSGLIIMESPMLSLIKSISLL